MSIELRHPSVGDGPDIHALVEQTGVLDVNSRYAYLAHCRHFAATTVVAHDDARRMVGFVTAYALPGSPETLFVWQVAVGESARGQGLAGRMLRWLVRAPACATARALHTTITPSNEPSRRLFRRFAEREGAQCLVEPCFDHTLLGVDHEPEELFRITPLPVPRRAVH